MRVLTYILCALDAAITATIMLVLASGIPDPATSGLDSLAGYIVLALCLVTAGPALVLAARNRSPKAALALATSFPLLLGLLVFFAAMLI
jgi:predicted permease